jgi:phosphoribosylaminoimidazole-succinocarboxamide synthase
MRKEVRTRAATKVASQLIPTEAAIDDAVAQISALTTVMLSARVEAELSAVVGQQAFDHIGEATRMLFQARSHIVQAHHHLADTKIEIGLRTVSLGDGTECPPMKGSAAIGDNVISIAA